MKIDELIQLFLDIIKRSQVEEDIYHAKDMLELAKKSRFKSKDYFILACVAHDLERSLPCRLRPENFENYNDFKKAHEKKSAELALKILKQLGVENEFASRVSRLISKHEFGDPDDDEAQELKFLDVLSFLKTNASFYAKRHTKKELEERIRWGLKRLDEKELDLLLSSLKITERKVKEALNKVLKTVL
jgi:hypothetical protein